MNLKSLPLGMKSLLLILLIFITISSTAQKIVSIEVHSIPLSIETVYDIPCSANFDIGFSSSLIIKKITRRDILSNIESLLDRFTSQKMNSIDVRGHLLIVYPHKTQQICFDRFGDFYKDGRYFTNIQLFQFLKLNRLISSFDDL